MPHKDPEQARLCKKRYRDKHRILVAAKRALPENREKQRVYSNARYAKNPQAYIGYNLKRYGITVEQYQTMFVAQNGKCAICETTQFDGPGKKLHVDHCHTTGIVRGLVCVRCNVLLGMAKDCPDRLTRAIAYLAQKLQPTLTCDPIASDDHIMT